MAHEVEELFYVEKVPWHGLGKKLDSPPTIGDAIKLAGLDWSVSKHQMMYKSPENGKLMATPRYAVLRDTDGQYLGNVGTSWTPLQNVDAFNWFQPFLSENLVTLETAGSLRKGKHVWVLAKIIGDPVDITRNDPVERFILLANGHDGTMAASATLTPIRVVCANTLALANESDSSKIIRVFHTRSVKDNMEAVRDTIDVVNNQFMATVSMYKDLARRDISVADLEKYVQRCFLPPRQLIRLEEEMKQIGVKTKLGSRIIDAVVPIFEKGRGNDMVGTKGTWWAAYNSVTEYLAHTRGQSRDVRTDSLWFGSGAVTNKKALDLAIEMAHA